MIKKLFDEFKTEKSEMKTEQINTEHKVELFYNKIKQIVNKDVEISHVENLMICACLFSLKSYNFVIL